MQNNIIIELNEREAIHKIQNGQWMTNLAKPVVISEGDTIQLKDTMIDAVAQSSEQITIPKDLKLVFKYGVYYNDWMPNYNLPEGQSSSTRPNENLYYFFYNNAGTEEPKYTGDGRYVIPYKKLGSLTGLTKAEGWEFGNPSTINNSQPFTVEYSYLNENNVLSYITHNIPTIPKGEEYGDVFNIIYKTGSFKIVSPNIDKIGLVSYGPINPEPISSDVSYVPYNFETSIILPKGLYTAQELSLFISKELSANNTTPFNQGTTTNYINNPFLKNVEDFFAGQPQPDGSSGNIADNVYYVRYNSAGNFDGAINIIYDDDLPDLDYNMFIGASQIALDYDEQDTSFKFSYMHTPLLDTATGKNLTIKYLNTGSNVSAISSHSGIYFTNLHAEDLDGNLFDFFNGLLGFDVDSICVDYVNLVENQYGVASSSWIVLDTLKTGVNITNNYIGIDSAIVKTANTWMKQQKIPTGTGSYINWTDSTADPDNTTEIKASIKLPELQNTFSHYFIDLGMKFQNELIGVDEVYRSYNGIVNKYYNFGSYIYSSDGSGSIVYQHKGGPITLKSVNCAIRKSSDRQVDENLGPNSCIYMQVIKASPKP
jgi:hypothetical protein